MGYGGRTRKMVASETFSKVRFRIRRGTCLIRFWITLPTQFNAINSCRPDGFRDRRLSYGIAITRAAKRFQNRTALSRKSLPPLRTGLRSGSGFSMCAAQQGKYLSRKQTARGGSEHGSEELLAVPAGGRFFPLRAAPSCKFRRGNISKKFLIIRILGGAPFPILVHSATGFWTYPSDACRQLWMGAFWGGTNPRGRGVSAPSTVLGGPRTGTNFALEAEFLISRPLKEGKGSLIPS